MPTFFRESSRRSQDADAPSILRTSRIARSVPKQTSFSVLAMFTLSVSAMSVCQAGRCCVQLSHRVLRIFLAMIQSISSSCSCRARTIFMAGMAASCFLSYVLMDAGMRGFWFSHQISAMLLSSFYTILQRRGRVLRIVSFAPMICFEPLRFGQMRYQSPNQSPEPTAVGAGSSAVAVHATSRRWLSFFR